MKSLDVIHDDSFLNTEKKSDVSFVGTKSFIPAMTNVNGAALYRRLGRKLIHSVNMCPNKN